MFTVRRLCFASDSFCGLVWAANSFSNLTDLGSSDARCIVWAAIGRCGARGSRGGLALWASS